MTRLTARILRLERRLPTGPQAELAAMSDAELERRLEAVLRQMSEEDVRAMAREHPDFFTPEVLEKELACWRELHGDSRKVQHEPVRRYPSDVFPSFDSKQTGDHVRHGNTVGLRKEVVGSVLGTPGAGGRDGRPSQIREPPGDIRSRVP